MSSETVIFFLCLGILLLLGILLYQQAVFRTGTQKSLREIHGKLREILDTDSDERVMVFTENRELMELAAQINRLLESHGKTKADYRRSKRESRRMLSNISHDMKTPMTVILGYLEILRVNPQAASAQEMLEKTELKARSMMDWIQQFFTLAKTEAGDMELELSSVDICEICRESILDFYEILTKADFQVEIDLPENAVYVQGNREALQRIFFNLISNAVRYGSAGNYLGVFLRTKEHTVCVEVTDKGRGIDEAFAGRIFDRLFTMEDSRSRSIQGSGLGLAIAKNLAQQMGGEILLKSTPSVKTTFTVRLKRGERNL